MIVRKTVTAARGPSSFAVLVVVFLACILGGVPSYGSEQQQCEASSSEEECSHRVADDCLLVYAPALDYRYTHQWGVYTMVPRKKGTPVRKDGDIVVQWTDPKTSEHKGVLKELAWDSQTTGGQYEGFHAVRSVVAGMGTMARRTTDKKKGNNVLPLVPFVDDGSLTRFDSPGAGAVTRYHNYTWWVSKDLEAGDELVYYYYYDSSSEKSTTVTTPITTEERPSQEYLKTHGYCLDHLRPRKSRIQHAGRGAFATQDLPAGSIVAPFPFALVHREELATNHQPEHQLLLNYCVGHKSSPWLLFPYSPVVNLINHYNEPNVVLKWSSRHDQMLELVATRDIQQGEEMYLDYGRNWEDSWWKHTQSWKPTTKHYTPSYVMDDAIKLIRTEQQQTDHPYPDNMFTSCFYKYSDRTDDEKAQASNNNNKQNDSLTSFRWHLTKGIYELKNLRPCKILKRVEDEASGKSTYAVRILNRPLLDETEIIPSGELHIVTHVPRSAIRFMDKPGTTDQHMDYAFRHEIGLPEELLPGFLDRTGENNARTN